MISKQIKNELRKCQIFTGEYEKKITSQYGINFYQFFISIPISSKKI